MTKSGTFKIRPAGRHVLTIGRDLIQDVHAAVVELVKNAYDADSPDVQIEFEGFSDQAGYSVTITDHGHGMTRDDVINKWMVPSTSDKLIRNTSPSGRIMQGRKGVGRYATSVLGDNLLLDTVTSQGEKTQVLIEWDKFANAAYLDDVEVSIDTFEVDEPPGTRLIIEGSTTHSEEWDQERFDHLRGELRKLQSPIPSALDHDSFDITLCLKNMPDVAELIDESIEPFPIFDLFDYRIAGSIDVEGKGQFEYTIQKIENSPEETIDFDLKNSTDCGRIEFDIRVYDRDSASINSLIGRGLKNDAGGYLGSREARQLLNNFNGIGVYRNGFRIRPLGDPGYDWLRLDHRRVQNPSLCLSSNQVIGVVQIATEEESGLVEKSARDGLKEDFAYQRLRDITTVVINLVETRRFRHRRMLEDLAVKGRIEGDLQRLASSDPMKTAIQTQLSRVGVSTEASDGILDIIDDNQRQVDAAIERLRDQITMYQGQATLGNIINVVLHEGRRPLSYFRNEIPYLRQYRERFLARKDEGSLEDILYVADGIGNNAEMFVKLFGRLDPLAARKRGPKVTFNLKQVLRESMELFEIEMTTFEIDHGVSCNDKTQFTGWPEDFRQIFDNLIENSIFWLTQSWDGTKRIDVIVKDTTGRLEWIDFIDTGPGIEPQFIENDLIFEPNFTTKPQGSGLGLAIAGEAANRNGLELMAIETRGGALFRLQPISERGHD